MTVTKTEWLVIFVAMFMLYCGAAVTVFLARHPGQNQISAFMHMETVLTFGVLSDEQ